VGGAGTVGAAVARRLAASGARVVVSYHRSVATGEQVVADIRASGGEAVPAPADLRAEREVARVLETAELFFGPVDLLVACACPEQEEASANDARWMLSLERFSEHVRGVVNVIRTVARGMADRRDGRIICVTTELGLRRLGPSPSGVGGYVARDLSRYAAVRLGPYGITGYAVTPGGAAAGEHPRQRAPTAPPGEASSPTVTDVAHAVASIAGEGV
jgi:3-oxoacyl-[acyl-carrier protein] reductase